MRTSGQRQEKHPVRLFTYAYVSGSSSIFCCLSHPGRPNDILTFSDQGFQINIRHYGDEKTGSCTCTHIRFLCTCGPAKTNEESWNKILTSPSLFYVTITRPFSPTGESLCAKPHVWTTAAQNLHTHAPPGTPAALVLFTLHKFVRRDLL